MRPMRTYALAIIAMTAAIPGPRPVGTVEGSHVTVTSPVTFGLSEAPFASPSRRPAFQPSGALASDAEVPSVSGPEYGSYAWPIQGPVLQPFTAPSTPFGAGHRGIDIAAAFGTDVGAANSGRVAFAGWIAGALFVSIDHPDGVRTTYSWLSGIAVAVGDPVKLGQKVGESGHGHVEDPTPHLHFGARIGDTYIDPMLLLEGVNVAGLIHLAPMPAA